MTDIPASAPAPRPAPLPAQKRAAPPSPAREVWLSMRANKGAMAGLAVIVLLALTAVFAAPDGFAADLNNASAAVSCVASVFTVSAAVLASRCRSWRFSAVSCQVLRSASVIGMSLSPLTRTLLVATSRPSTTSVTR